MTAPGLRHALLPGDLLIGEDHDFVVNAYIALLGRWPDEQGYRHFLAEIRDRPERRVAVLRSLAESEEARRHGPGRAALEIPAEGPVLPSDPRRALAAQLDLRTVHLHAEIERLREAVALLAAPGGQDYPGLGAEIIEARDAALRTEIEALRRELRAAPAGPHRDAAGGSAPAATAEERAAQAVSRLVADYMGELLALAEARVEARLRAVEARLIALGAASPPPA